MLLVEETNSSPNNSNSFTEELIGVDAADEDIDSPSKPGQPVQHDQASVTNITDVKQVDLDEQADTIEVVNAEPIVAIQQSSTKEGPMPPPRRPPSIENRFVGS